MASRLQTLSMSLGMADKACCKGATREQFNVDLEVQGLVGAQTAAGAVDNTGWWA